MGDTASGGRFYRICVPTEAANGLTVGTNATGLMMEWAVAGVE